jgi:hypothetical protein
VKKPKLGPDPLQTMLDTKAKALSDANSAESAQRAKDAEAAQAETAIAGRRSTLAAGQDTAEQDQYGTGLVKQRRRATQAAARLLG